MFFMQGRDCVYEKWQFVTHLCFLGAKSTCLKDICRIKRNLVEVKLQLLRLPFGMQR